MIKTAFLSNLQADPTAEGAVLAREMLCARHTLIASARRCCIMTRRESAPLPALNRTEPPRRKPCPNIVPTKVHS